MYNIYSSPLHGLSNRGVEIDVLQSNSRHLENSIVCGGQRFSNATALRDALYLMFGGGRFRCYFKRNMRCLYKGFCWGVGLSLQLTHLT